ncbi:hypothetical protein B0H14DRAFT_3472629 [Mycena olivaceomarginata]|nr:hypothetical protein B0H14DRAFT_3472629 [Mycena olivaceomarginata]
MAQTPAEIATTENTSLKKSVEEMSKNITTIAAQLAHQSGASALELLVGLPANPLALPPNANVPLSLVAGLNGEAQFVAAAPVPGATTLLCEVPDILAFVKAWMIFMSVLQNEHRGLPVVQGLSAHLNNIIAVARVYPWPTVLNYHVAFMHLHARNAYFNPLSWSQSSPHLHTTHLLIPSILLPPATAPPAVMPLLPAAAAPAVMSSQERTWMAGQPCYAWNGLGPQLLLQQLRLPLSEVVSGGGARCEVSERATHRSSPHGPCEPSARKQLPSETNVLPTIHIVFPAI